MSYNIFLASDHHFGHRNIYDVFKRPDGSPVRDFQSMEEGEEIIVQRHNAVVKPNDRVYFLGDVAMPKSGLATLAKMNGRKVLIKGNHDVHKLSQYVQYFDDIRGSHQLSGILMTHIPVHEDSLARWGFNVHGHLHTNRVRTWDGSIDERYLCVCVEQISYTPISLEEVKSKRPI